MEICYESVNALKLIAGVNENVGPIVILADLALGGADRLKRTAAGGADGDCPFAVCLSEAHRISSCCENRPKNCTGFRQQPDSV